MDGHDQQDSNNCHVCREPYGTDQREHNNSVNHRYQFRIWEYNQYRKALARDRHGIKIEVAPEIPNSFHLNFNNLISRGKYITTVTAPGCICWGGQSIKIELKGGHWVPTIRKFIESNMMKTAKVSPEQLGLHNSTITFNCTIKNIRKDPVYITGINLLHTSTYFNLIQDHDFGLNLDTFLQLQPGCQYNFKVVYTTNVLTPSSYKIPISFDLQTVDNQQSFTIIRNFLIIVDDQEEEKEVKKKSPFTSKLWKEVTKTHPTTRETTCIDHYPIPFQYQRILKHGLRRFNNMSHSDTIYLRELNQTVDGLTRDNYNKFWHTLLWMEEVAQALMLTKYNMEKVTMDIIEDEILVLVVPGLAEKRPSVIVGDFIKIRLTGDHTAYRGFVSQVNDRTVEISYVDDELMDYVRDDPTTEFDVAFILSRLAFERMHSAVDRIVATNMVSLLFPRGNEIRGAHISYNLQDSAFYNEEIVHNNEQRNAVMKILNSTQTLPYIVFGPPGTGKTVTIVEAILQIKKHTKKRILVCAPANSACDVIAKKLIPYCTTAELIRIHSSTRERTSITPDLVEYSNIEDDEFTRPDIAKLLTYRIVVTTLTLIGRYARHAYQSDCVFIDEAAQASEPESDIAISLLSIGKQVVLAGDPKQLGPMVTECASKLGLGISLLERLMGNDIYLPHSETRAYNSNVITMLKLNFRSHPDILFIPNELFYENNLEARSALAMMDPIANIPIYPEIEKHCTPRKKKNKGPKAKATGALEFCSISSKEKREGSSPSYFNLFEAKMVIKYVKALVNLNLVPEHRVTLDQIGVVTPYKRQVHKILEMLRSSGFEGVEVGTAESFQGREKRIIIISTVRAQHALLLFDRKYSLGFVKQDQRFNVAVTRAISRLIVIGCPLVLRSDNKWEMFIDWCIEHSTYFGNRFEVKDDRFKGEVLRRMQHYRSVDQQYRHNNN